MCEQCSTENSVWPDESLEPLYPQLPKPQEGVGELPYRFLNSGGFMATVAAINRWLEVHIDPWEDDQLYYTVQFLARVAEPEKFKHSVALDYDGVIFQVLHHLHPRRLPSRVPLTTTT